MIINTLGALGCGFDCASKTEILDVLSFGIPSSKIIYANPIKDVHSLKFAKSQDIDMMTFDNEYELYKIKENHPNAKLVVRIKTDDSKSVFKFSTKFGCTLEEAMELIEKAKSLDLNVIGVSFHVGSKCNNDSSYSKAISDARKLFDKGNSVGMDMYLLDIGGGFPGCLEDSSATFPEMAQTINQAIEQYFSDLKNVKVIAEPGRYFATKSHTLVFNVVGKRKYMNEDGTPCFLYYMNDGIYGSFNCIKFDAANPKIIPVLRKGEDCYKTTFFGPTCDSIDTIFKEIDMPELSIGEWCFVENFGAYTRASASNFNGFKPPRCVYIMHF